ncbi:hypothetical protein [Myxosarcina sp. GI1]|uniref:hypothetical protein n=1 Tax=Myxosarcina sp. GI1 TaxID=1541065 RepID=UPI00056D53D2|nr:hypothetical protein [Myxosarcina sp. GI1]
MSEEKKKVVSRTNPDDAEAGKGAPGQQTGVQTAQTTAVNPPDAKIPSGADVEQNVKQVEAEKEQEAGTGMKTTDGYTVDESGRLDNYPVEPEPYVEEK